MYTRRSLVEELPPTQVKKFFENQKLGINTQPWGNALLFEGNSLRQYVGSVAKRGSEHGH